MVYSSQCDRRAGCLRGACLEQAEFGQLTGTVRQKYRLLSEGGARRSQAGEGFRKDHCSWSETPMSHTRVVGDPCLAPLRSCRRVGN